MKPVALPAQSERARRVSEKLRRELGPEICACLADPSVIEIMLNADGVLWVERFGRAMERLGLMPACQAEAFIATVAAIHRTVVDRLHPILECELPFDGSRFEALIPPAVSAPVFAIRRRPETIFTLADYVEAGIMTGAQSAVLRRAVEERLNILIVGGTGSGKTTLLNAVIDHMATACPDDRPVIMEDTAEIRCASANAVLMKTADAIDMNRLTRAAMRLRPDRMLVGEVRGGEAHALIKAWNTGHPGGAATIHANSARAGLIRMESLVAEATAAPMQKTIAAAVNLVAFIAKTGEGRRVRELLRVHGFDGADYVTSTEE
jgi:P-type conjugative transfer ATPase TrbB